MKYVRLISLIIFVIFFVLNVLNILNILNSNIHMKKNDKNNILLLHFDSVKSRKIRKVLISSGANVTEYNPYKENLTSKKIESYKRCDGLVISGSNPDMRTIEIPRINIVPFGKSMYGRIERVIDLFQGEGKKILGICYGSQLLWHYYGGGCEYHKNVYGSRKGEHDKKIRVLKPVDDILKGCCGKGKNKFNFYRNILLDPGHVPKNAKILALDETIYKGKRFENISTFRMGRRRVWGVIFHPESSMETGGSDIFNNVLRA